MDYLDMICCPETKLDLTVADSSIIEKINDKIKQGELKTQAGILVDEQIDGGLMRVDEKVIYPVKSNIPIMLKDQAILVSDL